ncbi:hypothetical protein H2203_000898 [Taxawa tesnikishii (nom. ined.)]|nr:hypothetical protein H2203_000898 [Dothideales sp. JES 119]
MSFFRRTEDTTSSSTGDSRSKEDTDPGDHSGEADALGRIQTIGSTINPNGNTHDHQQTALNPIFATHNPKDILLSSLLEDKCINEALSELNAAGAYYQRDDPNVRSLASQKFQRAFRTLEQAGLVVSGLETANHDDLRQRFREGLNLITKENVTPTQPISPRKSSQLLPQLAHDVIASTTGLGPGGRELVLAFQNATNMPSSPQLPSLMESLAASHPLLDSNRYTRDFTENSILGKGGYGMVFHVNHRLDGNTYAVKKVPLTRRQLKRIEKRGQQELDTILVELRTLARLDHPNIARYYGGWIEWTQQGPSSGGFPISDRKLLEAPTSRSSEEYDELSESQQSGAFSPQLTYSRAEDPGIIFEFSDVDATRTEEDPFSDAGSLEKVRTRSTHASAENEDEEVEYIRRQSEPSAQALTFSTDNAVAATSEPSLTLHIQMAVYYTTLAEYLSPVDPYNPVLQLRHCFHLRQSLRMLLSILDGVAYLHQEGIVHRDLKPGNIFLSLRTNEHPCTIPLSSCPLAQSLTTTLTLHAPNTISASASATSANVAEGDRYRDVFALGMVAFELLWPFGTRMERVETLQKLRRGVFPDDFCSRIGDGGEVKGLVERMLGEVHGGPSCAEIKKRVEALLD